MQVKDAGGSKSRAVMVRIGVIALTRKGADFPRVSQDENPWQTYTLGMFTTGSLELQAARGISSSEMQGPCEVLSSRSDDRARYRAFVMRERRAVKVACAVLRGRGGGDTALLPGGRIRLDDSRKVERMELHWIPLHGAVEIGADYVRFTGQQQANEGGTPGSVVGRVLNNQQFGGGAIEAEITFSHSNVTEVCGLILFYQPGNQSFVEAQVGGDFLCSVWSFAGGRWYPHGSAGDGRLIQPGRPYKFSVLVSGSSVSLRLDGVEVLNAALPVPLPRGQAGLFFRGMGVISVASYRVVASQPKTFIVMQFTPPYNELYAQVIAPVCEKLGLKAERADEKFGPGVVIQDIERQILEAQVVIGDVTPKNANVYYEVGYANALKKPTILIAESPTELPFDVSPFHVLFYENTIAGKAKIEAGLRNHLQAIQEKWSAPLGAGGPV